MALLAVKLLLAPSFVVGASLAARRFGPRVGGLIGALPVVAGPILLVYALAHGTVFAAGAAAGSLLGLISLTGFVVVYGAVSQRAPWYVSLPVGWLGFCGATFAFSGLSLPARDALALACVAFAIGLLLLPRPRSASPAWTPPSAWDLPLRAACAMALVLALTAAAGWLGPRLSGLLAPFPIIASVLAVFTHTQRGAGEALRLLRGLLVGFGAFALFCFTVAVSVRPLGVGVGFVLATGVAVLAQSAVLSLIGRAPGSAPAPVASAE